MLGKIAPKPVKLSYCLSWVEHKSKLTQKLHERTMHLQLCSVTTVFQMFSEWMLSTTINDAHSFLTTPLLSSVYIRWDYADHLQSVNVAAVSNCRWLYIKATLYQCQYCGETYFTTAHSHWQQFQMIVFHVPTNPTVIQISSWHCIAGLHCSFASWIIQIVKGSSIVQTRFFTLPNTPRMVTMPVTPQKSGFFMLNICPAYVTRTSFVILCVCIEDHSNFLMLCLIVTRLGSPLASNIMEARQLGQKSQPNAKQVWLHLRYDHWRVTVDVQTSVATWRRMWGNLLITQWTVTGNMYFQVWNLWNLTPPEDNSVTGITTCNCTIHMPRFWHGKCITDRGWIKPETYHRGGSFPSV